MDKNFTQKVAIVTGGAQGIGKAITMRLLQAGARVMIADYDAEAGQETIEEYQDLGQVRFVQTDVSDEASVRAMVEQTISAFHRLDILINNAGIADPYNEPIEQLSLERWNRMLAVNLTGAFLCTKYAVLHLRQQGGAIINIASTRAAMSEPSTEAYSATKGGLVALTHALANSLGPEIRVNCISPGWIAVGQWQKRSKRHSPQLSEADHQQHPVGRVGKPEDIAAMVLYLASEQAGFITGMNVTIDGGMTHKMIYLEE
ncbi:glucose 1-dehydrogenase [Phormidium tenue FACHB-886]|nr:glucose 1-dehydrogenase [Phormidium tenue FACHB-886]